MNIIFYIPPELGLLTSKHINTVNTRFRLATNSKLYYYIFNDYYAISNSFTNNKELFYKIFLKNISKNNLSFVLYFEEHINIDLFKNNNCKAITTILKRDYVELAKYLLNYEETNGDKITANDINIALHRNNVNHFSGMVLHDDFEMIKLILEHHYKDEKENEIYNVYDFSYILEAIKSNNYKTFYYLLHYVNHNNHCLSIENLRNNNYTLFTNIMQIQCENKNKFLDCLFNYKDKNGDQLNINDVRHNNCYEIRQAIQHKNYKLVYYLLEYKDNQNKALLVSDISYDIIYSIIFANKVNLFIYLLNFVDENRNRIDTELFKRKDIIDYSIKNGYCAITMFLLRQNNIIDISKMDINLTEYIKNNIYIIYKSCYEYKNTIDYLINNIDKYRIYLHNSIKYNLIKDICISNLSGHLYIIEYLINL